MLKAVSDNSRVIYAGLLIQWFLRVVFADDDGEVAGWVQKNLVAAYSVDGLQWDWFAMTGQFRKC
jgi:hypothetical protein